MSSRKTCDKCVHYSTERHLPKGLGDCDLMGDYNALATTGERFRNVGRTLAYGWDYESYIAGVHVGEKFGCIHWEKKG